VVIKLRASSGTPLQAPQSLPRFGCVSDRRGTTLELLALGALVRTPTAATGVRPPYMLPLRRIIGGK
jgi:hypothetical protein